MRPCFGSTRWCLVACLLGASLTWLDPVQSFVPVDAIPSTVRLISTQRKTTPTAIVVSHGVPRGGATSSLVLQSLPQQIVGLVSSSLQSGPYGILALSAVTSSVVLPLTLYKKFYGISVAYGFSVLAAGWTMLHVFSSSSLDPMSAGSLLAKACMFYGFRLGAFILLRSAIREEGSSMKNGSVTSRLIFSASLAPFYALLVTPVLYACRDATTPSTTVALAGAALAFGGALLEAMADGHKLAQKSFGGGKPKVEEFVGPTTWTYRLCRHPNYLGEILMWVGLYLGGAPSFGSSIQAWVGSSLGLFGIVSIMLQATAGLEKRQGEKYKGQKLYEDWKAAVPAPLFPFVNQK
jgi:steroid 5-alpha reductase family enzyme